MVRLSQMAKKTLKKIENRDFLSFSFEKMAFEIAPGLHDRN